MPAMRCMRLACRVPRHTFLIHDVGGLAKGLEGLAWIFTSQMNFMGLSWIDSDLVEKGSI